MSVKIALISFSNIIAATIDIGILATRTTYLSSTRVLRDVIDNGIQLKASEAEIRAFVNVMNDKDARHCHATKEYVEKVAAQLKVKDIDSYNHLLIDDMIVIKDRDQKVSYSMSLSQLAEDYEYFECLMRTPLGGSLGTHILDLDSAQVTFIYYAHTEDYMCRKCISDTSYDETNKSIRDYEDIYKLSSYLQERDDKLLYMWSDMALVDFDLSFEYYTRIGKYRRRKDNFVRRKIAKYKTNPCPNFDIIEQDLLKYNKPCEERAWDSLVNKMPLDPITRDYVYDELNNMDNEKLFSYTDDPVWCFIYGAQNIYPEYDDIVELEKLIESENKNKYAYVTDCINIMKRNKETQCRVT